MKNITNLFSDIKAFSDLSSVHKKDLKQSNTLVVVLLIFIFGLTEVFAQSAGDYRSKTNNVNWSSLSSWERYDGSNWGTPTAEHGYPGEKTGTGNVLIRFGGSIVLNLSPTNAIGSLTIGDGTTNGSGLSNNTATLSITSYTLSVTGNISIYNANQSRDGILNNGTGTIKTSGSFSNGGTYTAGSGTFEYNAADTQNITASGYYNLTVGGSGTKTLTAALAVTGNLTIKSGATLDLATFASTAATLTLGTTAQQTSTSFGGTGSAAANIDPSYFQPGTGYLNVGTCGSYNIGSLSAISTCIGTPATVNLTSTAANLPDGTYTVYYTIGTLNAGTGTSVLTISNGNGDGSFTTYPLNSSGTTGNITINYIRNGCVSAENVSKAITVNPNNIAGAASSAPTLCQNTALTNIIHNTTDANAVANEGVYGANGLPAGVKAEWGSNKITISGTPTAAGTFNYSIPLTGGCGNILATGTITVNAAPTIALTTGTQNQTVCSGTAITTTVYTFGGSAANVTVTNLPAGLTATVNTSDNTVTISGNPTAGGTYSISTTGQSANCSAATISGIITINDLPSVPSAITPSAAISICSGTSTNIKATTGSGISVDWYTTATGGSSVGTSTTNNNYSVSPSSTITYYAEARKNTTGCVSSSRLATALITVNPASTIALTAGTQDQTLCIGTALTTTVYSFGGSATNAAVSGLPAGLSHTVDTTAKTVTISGTPTASGTYTITTSGHSAPCSAATVSATVTVNTPATITTQPTAPANFCSGTGTKTVTVVATGTGLIYQWRKNGVNLTDDSVISQATTATLKISSPTESDAGSYDVVISGTCAPAVTSNPVTVTVNSNTAIVSQPVAPEIICTGNGTQTISVSATGTDLTYQWKKGGSNLSDGAVFSGTTTNTLTLTNPTTANEATNYKVFVSGTCGNLTSDLVTVAIYPASVGGSITGGGSVCPGNNSPLLTLTGNTGTVVKWQSSIDSGSNWSDIINSASTYTSGAINQSTQFRAVVQSGSCATANSEAATVIPTVPSIPVVGTITHPTCSVVTGSVDLSNLPGGEWTINPGNITGSTSTTTLTGLASGTYNFTVTNSSGCVSPATNDVGINEAPVVPTVPLTGTINQPSVEGGSGSFIISNYNSSYTYAITPSAGTSMSGDTVTAPAGDYTLTATLGACISAESDTVSIIAYNEPSTATWEGPLTGDWFEPTNWAPEGVPTATTDVIVPDTFTISITGTNAIAYANSITVQNGGTLNVDSDTILNVTDAVTVISGGTLNLANNASLVQVNSSALNSGNINVARDTAKLKLNDYTYWSSPTNGTQTLQNFSPNSNLKYFLAYHNGWSYANPAKTTFAPATGYAILAPKGLSNSTAVTKSFTFIGTPNNGDVNTEVTLSGVPDFFSSKLIGNPYPSAIDANMFIDANIYDEDTNPDGTISGTLYFWTHNSALSNGSYNPNNYAAYNKSGGTNLSEDDDAAQANKSKPQQFIASGQGFIVEILNSGEVHFTNAMRINGTATANGNFYKNANGKPSKGILEKNRIWLNLTNSSGVNLNQILIGYIETATNNFDPGFDGAYNSSIKTGLYSLIGNESYTIQAKALPFSANDVVPLGFTTDIKGNSTISIDSVDGLFTNGQDIFIEDKLTNVIHNLKTSPYTFSSETGTFNNRFVLRYSNNTLSVNDIHETTNQVMVTVNNQVIKVFCESELIDSITVYDMAGKVLYQKSGVGSNESLITQLNQQQFLLVKIVLENGNSVSKKIIN